MSERDASGLREFLRFVNSDKRCEYAIAVALIAALFTAAGVFS